MLRRGLLAAGAAVLAAACAAPAAHARIAFVTNREGDREIYLMDDAGGGLVNLTNDFSEDYDPAWSPDATRIAFTRDDGTGADIMTTTVSTQDAVQVQLTDAPAADEQPAWSPDGRRIAFVSARSGGPEVWVMNADGSAQTQVTGTGGHAQNPSWSPDGSRLAYWRDDTQQVHVVAPDGSGDAAVGAGGTADRQPVWSPDGARLAVASARGGGGLDVWAMGADALAPVDLTPVPGSDSDPSWSADGRIVFTSNRDGNPEIYVMNGDGSGQTRLTHDPGADTSPAWQPPGATATPGSPGDTPPDAGAPGAPSAPGSSGAGAPAAGGATTVAGSQTPARRPRPGSRPPATAHHGTLRIRIDLRFTPVRVLPGRLLIAIPVRVNRTSVVTIEVRHHDRRVVLVTRRLRRGTTVLRWSRKIGAQGPWRGTYRIGLYTARF